MQGKTGLIIIDIQGNLARLVNDSDTLITNCVKLVKGAQILSLPIISLEQNPDKLGSTVSELSRLMQQITPLEKYTFNACGSPDFIKAVKSSGVDTWLICGIESHICVYQTVIGLAELGYNVQVVSDCVASRTSANQQLGLNRLQQRGIEITGLEMCLYELLKDCRAPEFKAILQLVK